MKRLLALSLVAFALSTAQAPRAQAGWLDGLGRAIGDVVTGCETCRARDRDAARRDEADAAARQAAAEQLRQQNIAKTKELRDATLKAQQDYAYFSDSLVSIGDDAGHLVESAKKEVVRRSWITTSFLPLLKKLIGMDIDYNDEVLTAMQELATEAAAPTVSTGNASADLEANRASAQRSADAIRRLQDVARTHGVEMNRMVSEAIARANSDQAEAMLATLVGTQAKIAKLREYANARRDDSQKEVDRLNEALKQLGA